MKINSSSHLPPRLGGKVTVIAEGKVNPGEVSPDGKAVVFGEFVSGEGESVFRWKDGLTEKLNADGHSSYEAHCNFDASVVTYHRYSLADATDDSGNWDIVRWQDGKADIIAQTGEDERAPGIDYSGNKIVFESTIKANRKAQIKLWDNGETKVLTDGSELDTFPEIAGNGSRVAFRRNYNNVMLHDQNGVNKPIAIAGERPGSLTIDRTGNKLLYAAYDEDGDQNLYLTDLANSQTTEIGALKGVEEYEGAISGDGSTVVYTGIDFRKEKGYMNVYVWRNGATEQLTWNDGGRNNKPSVSFDGKAISWYWTNADNIDDRKVLLWRKDE